MTSETDALRLRSQHWLNCRQRERGSIHDHFNPERNLTLSPRFKQRGAAAQCEWQAMLNDSGGVGPFQKFSFRLTAPWCDRTRSSSNRSLSPAWPKPSGRFLCTGARWAHNPQARPILRKGRRRSFCSSTGLQSLINVRDACQKTLRSHQTLLWFPAPGRRTDIAHAIGLRKPQVPHQLRRGVVCAVL